MDLKTAVKKITGAFIIPRAGAIFSQNLDKAKPEKKEEMPFSIFEAEKKIKQRKKRISEEMPED